MQRCKGIYGWIKPVLRKGWWIRRYQNDGTIIGATWTTGKQKLYVNGQLVRTVRHQAGNSIVPLTTSPDMKIGNSLSKKGCFNGVIEGVCIFNRPLSDQEVLDIFNN